MALAISSTIVGMRFHQPLVDIRPTDRLTLLQEPDNPYDAKAVAVLKGDRVVGHLSRRESVEVFGLLNRYSETVRLGHRQFLPSEVSNPKYLFQSLPVEISFEERATKLVREVIEKAIMIFT